MIYHKLRSVLIVVWLVSVLLFLWNMQMLLAQCASSLSSIEMHVHSMDGKNVPW